MTNTNAMLDQPLPARPWDRCLRRNSSSPIFLINSNANHGPPNCAQFSTRTADAFTVTPAGGEPQRVEIHNDGLAHEAAHAMARIRAGHLQSDVITWDRTIANMELMDEIRRQLGVVYPVER